MLVLTANTIVRDSAGNAFLLNFGDEPPEWSVPLLDSSLLAEAGIPVETETVDESEGEEPDETVEETVEESSDELVEVPIPPVAGRGSSAAAWAKYALSMGFEVDGDAKASEIREALAEAGIPVE